MKPKFFMQVMKNGRGYPNINGTTHEINATASKNRKLFPLFLTPNGDKGIIIGSTFYSLHNFRIIDDEAATKEINEIDSERLTLLKKREQIIKKAHKRKAIEKDFE